MPYEVDIRLSFIEPCLGNERYPDPEPNRMLRNTEGTVVFMQAWWRTVLLKAAQAYGKHQDRVKQVRWTPEIDGTVKLFTRYYFVKANNTRVQHAKAHEAFERGDVIGVRALVPDDVPLVEFREILQLAGTYFGISPFGWRRGFGKFNVVEMHRVYGNATRSNIDNSGKPDVRNAGNGVDLGNSEGVLEVHPPRSTGGPKADV